MLLLSLQHCSGPIRLDKEVYKRSAKTFANVFQLILSIVKGQKLLLPSPLRSLLQRNFNIRGSLNKFPDFFRIGTFIEGTHMKL